MRILVTNDDGIDSVGLHELARAMTELGDVVVAAPDSEYSGAGAAIGALHLLRPEVQVAEIDGVKEAWAVSGAPALCVMFARLGAFGDPFDLVVSGINPGVNVGRSIYHSGTVGAALTARNGGISGVAVSQAVTGFGVEGQGFDEMLEGQRWDVAASVARSVVGGLVEAGPDLPVVVNVNVPDCPLEEIRGWRKSEVGFLPPRTMGGATLEPKEGYDDTFEVRMDWGDRVELAVETDGGAVEAGYVAVSYLSAFVDEHRRDLHAAEAALDDLFDA